MTSTPPPIPFSPPPPLATLVYPPDGASDAALRPVIWLSLFSTAAPLLADGLQLIWIAAGMMGTAGSSSLANQRGTLPLAMILLRFAAGAAVITAGVMALKSHRIGLLALCCIVFTAVTVFYGVVIFAYQWNLYFSRSTANSIPYTRSLITSLLVAFGYGVAPAAAAVVLNGLRRRR